jgi:hypothetical protein
MLTYEKAKRLLKMKTTSKIEQEVNKIRLQIYEKTKDMTPSQLTEYYRRSGEASAQKYGFKIVESAKESYPSSRE